MSASPRASGFTFNYTWSKNIGDDGTFRYGYDLPGSVTTNGQSYKQNRIDRSQTTTNIPQNISFYGIYSSPFSSGKNFFVRNLLGGWQFSHIYTYTSGVPLVITSSACTNPNAGQCVPDLNPNYVGNGRKNGKYGVGETTAFAVQYLDPNAFIAPSNFGAGTTPITKISVGPRTAPYGLHAPSRYNLDIGLHRTFNLTPERVRFIFEANGLNITNHVTFNNLSSAWSPGSTSFGQFTGAGGNRDFQFAGRIRF